MSRAFDIDALEAAVRAARDQSEDAVAPAAAVPGEDPDAPRRILAELEENRNCKAGVPLGRQRRPGAVVKKIFRRLFQPFLNETLERQSRFNEASCDLAAELFARVNELEREVRALREGAAPGRPQDGPRSGNGGSGAGVAQ